MAGFTVTETEQQGIEVARSLIAAGVPVFAAEPCADGCTIKGHRGGAGQYHLPKQWEKTYPSEVNLEKWRPGWALAAVGGHAVDFLDVDPRAGGDESLRQLQELGQMPRVFAVARTPSGGTHYTISATGERKYTGFMPGLDLQSGSAGGQGRGFVWIAPTVRASKANHDAGTLRAYVWEKVPDPAEVVEWVGTHDPSIEPIVSRVRAKRATPAQRDPVVLANPDDPFLTASMTHGTDRSFSVVEAQDFVRPYLYRLQEAPIGEIEERCNVAAAVLSHFVPNFWTADAAMDLLHHSLAQTAYDPNGPSNWTAEKFRGVLDGTRPTHDPWTAVRKPEPAAPPAQVIEPAPGEEGLTTLEKLRRRLVSAEQLMTQPPPEFLVHGLLNLNTEAWMIGASGSLKSFVALDLAGHVAAGRPWQGHRVRQAKVLILVAEGATGMVLRVRAYVKVHGGMDDVTFLPYPVQVSSSDGQWEALVTLASELKPGLIIIDTQARVSVGLEENSAKDMGILINAVGKLKAATGACVLTIHHTGRNGGDARGSSAIDGAQDTELKVKRIEPRELLRCQLVQDKQKDMSEGSGATDLQLKVIDLGTDPVSGEHLSSLVVSTDPFETSQGHTEAMDVDVDMQIWRDIVVPEPWTAKIAPPNARVKRRALQVLADHAHTIGLTSAQARRIVSERWEKVSNGWDAVWTWVIEQEAVVNTGGQRYALDQTVLGDLKADKK